MLYSFHHPRIDPQVVSTYFCPTHEDTFLIQPYGPGKTHSLCPQCIKDLMKKEDD